MSPDTHKWLDFAQHLGYYISGFFAVVGAVFMYWRSEKKADRERLGKNEKQIAQLVWLAENSLATKDELTECGKEKDDQHHKGIKDVITKLDENGKEHDAILEKMNDQHAETLSTIATLHSK